MTNHGVREPFFGVKIGDLKKLQKRIKKDHKLALELYDTGNYDAMYLAGLIADDSEMTRPDLDRWVKAAYGGALAGFTVPWVAAGSPHGWAMAEKWIASSKPTIASAGWATYASLASLEQELSAPSEVDGLSRLELLRERLRQVEESIHQAPNEVRYAMNSYVIALGSYVAELADEALAAARRIGPVEVDLGNNDCKTPDAAEYILKSQARGSLMKKRKSVKC